MGQKFRLRANCGFRFIRGDKITTDLVVDSDDPGFASQRHKFEDTPIDDGTATKIADTTKKAETDADLAEAAKMKRPELIALYQSIAGAPPPETIKVGELRQIFELVSSGMSIQEATTEVCGETAPTGATTGASAGVSAADSASGV